MQELPDTQYYLTLDEFDKAVGEDFIRCANAILEKGQKFIVGLSHGQSPAGAYAYIITNYHRLAHPGNILYTFVNSPLPRQRGLNEVTDAREFLRRLYRRGFILRRQIIGYEINRESMESYKVDFNKSIAYYMREYDKDGLDYVFLACDPEGRVAAIARHSSAFTSKEFATLINETGEIEISATPAFLLRSKRIAFLATKSDKRRPLAWLFASDAKPAESPGFLRFLPDIKKRMTVFIDDNALTWPQVEVERQTPYGKSVIRIDTSNPYEEDMPVKLPVVLLIHGFLGLNSYDGLLASLSSHLCIGAAMHYGTIPNDLPPEQYSHHITRNIESVVKYFGQRGHPVYIFDHSMGNIYSMMIDQHLNEYPGISQYLRGRIGANPFFGEEAKHAVIGFLDNVILPALSGIRGLAAKSLMLTMRNVIPFDTKWGVRRRGIELCDWLIKRDSSLRDRIWQAAKLRILFLMTNMDSLPHLNRIPIERALSRLPAKLLAIQVFSALQQSKAFDHQTGLISFPVQKIPSLILKSERDGVAKYVERFYEGMENVKVIDVTNDTEKDLFREHLYHMVEPEKTTRLIEDFLMETEKYRETKLGSKTETVKQL